MNKTKICLKKLTQENICDIQDTRIICFEKSISYLKELAEKYPALLEHIQGFVDDYKRNQGEFLFCNRRFAVWDTKILDSIDWQMTTLLITGDYFIEAYEKLCENSVVMENVDTIYYFANAETEVEQEYRDKYKDCDLQDIIVFRSGPHASSYVKGMDFADNARALFEYMLAVGFNKRYELVWLVKNPDEFEMYAKYPNVKFLSFDWSCSAKEEERSQYYRVLCLAKYLFFTDAYGFARNCREEQVRVQLWHGCGFKTRVNFVRCEKRYEYTTVISDLYADIHADIYGLRKEQVLVAGYPKQDWLFHPISREKLLRLGIPKAEKYIFWLPTFRATEDKMGTLNEYSIRSEVGLPIINTVEQLEELNHLLMQNNMVLVVKLHPFQRADEVKCQGFSNIYLLDNATLLLHDVQINQVLGWADALLSDYSSAAVDYLILNRPIGFTLDDVDRYADSRGFVFENIREWLPGRELYEYREFKKFFEDISKNHDRDWSKRNKIRKQMHNFEDDKSCERLVRVLGIEL